MEKYLERTLDTYELVHHLNGIGKDNRIDNLELTNRSEHARCHMDHSPCYGQGEQNHQAKLKAADIPIIRSLLKMGLTLAEIGRIFNVNHGTIKDIRNGKTWRHY